MRNLKEISTKLSSKTESSQDVRVESCSWCGENGHNALWCPHNSNQEERFEHINMVNGGYYGNQGGLNKPTLHTSRGNPINNKVGTTMMMLSIPYSKLWMI